MPCKSTQKQPVVLWITIQTMHHSQKIKDKRDTVNLSLAGNRLMTINSIDAKLLHNCFEILSFADELIIVTHGT